MGICKIIYFTLPIFLCYIPFLQFGMGKYVSFCFSLPIFLCFISFLSIWMGIYIILYLALPIFTVT